jgi:hypothetical protein
MTLDFFRKNLHFFPTFPPESRYIVGIPESPIEAMGFLNI